MPPGVQVVQAVQNQVKALEEVNVELWVLDVGVVWGDADIGLEGADDLCCCDCLAAADVGLAEKELAVEVAGLDCIQINLEKAHGGQAHKTHKGWSVGTLAETGTSGLIG